MIGCLFLLLYAIVVDTAHFNGGTIRWTPINPYDNSSSVAITITQSYAWSYPLITCATNVPITTSGRSTSNWNLTCVVDCSTDGGYSTQPVDILTDCTSVSSSLGMMNSQRSHNLTLAAGAHFYLANVGSAWRALNSPVQAGRSWSIVSLIDLRMRADGFINTPPSASVVSPQYVIVNRTSQIQIPVSDVNTGDDVRCRWSTYTAGYRRRKRFDEEEHINQGHADQLYKTVMKHGESIHTRQKRGCGGPCGGGTICLVGCLCQCFMCDPAICTGSTCNISPDCSGRTTTTTTTTIDTPGTLPPTSSYSHRQAIDECGGICYPSSVPTGTTLSNCALSFTGLTSGIWYAVAIQVEDFINTTSLTPMSSIPIQFLIYVMPEPACSSVPTIIPLSDCLEVTVGVSQSFNLSVLNLCDPNTTSITDIIVSQGINGMQVGNLTQWTTNSSLSDMTFMWTPQANQIGSQQLCTIAYLSNFLQSAQYCVTFNVITSSDVCKTTTTTSTTSSTSTSTATTSTATTTTSISTTIITIIAAAATPSTTTPGTSTSWGLIAGISSLALPLALCSCFCLYRLLWSPTAKRRRQGEEEEEEEDRGRYQHLTSSTESMVQTNTQDTNKNAPIEVPRKSYQVYNILPQKNNANSVCSNIQSEGSILMTIYNNTNARRTDSLQRHSTTQSLEMGNAWMQPSTDETMNSNISITRRITPEDSSVSKVSNFKAKNEHFNIDRQLSNRENARAFSVSPFNNGPSSALQSSLETRSDIGGDRSLRSGLYKFRDWTRLYLFGHQHDTVVPQIPRSS